METIKISDEEEKKKIMKAKKYCHAEFMRRRRREW